MNDTKLIQLDTNLFNEIELISKLLVKQINRKKLILPLKNRLIILESEDTLRAISGFVPSNDKSRIARDILIRMLYQAEQQCHGSAWILLNQIANEQILEKESCKLSKKILHDECARFLGDGLGFAFFEALEHGGPTSAIHVTDQGKNTYVRVTDELVLPGTYPVEFGESINLDAAYIVVFDGVIEKISEINRLLEELNKEGRSAILFARGYGYEVVSTLLHNWRLGKLKVIPVSADVDIVSEFAFIDLPKVLSDEPQIVTQIPSLEDACEASVVTLRSGRVSIQDQNISKRCQRVSSEILKDIGEISGSTKWIIDRTKKISSRCITINIGQDQGQSVGILKDRINSIVRFVTSARAQGITKVEIGNENYVICKNAINIAKKVNQSIQETTNIKNLVVLDNVA